MDNNRIFYLISSIEEELNILRESMEEEILNEGEIANYEKEICRAVATIKNDAEDFLSLSNRKEDGMHNFILKDNHLRYLQEARDRLKDVIHFLSFNGIEVSIMRYDDHCNFITAYSTYENNPRLSTNVAPNCDTVQIYFDRFITDSETGFKVKEHYTVPALNLDNIIKIITMTRPESTDDIPLDIIPYRK